MPSNSLIPEARRSNAVADRARAAERTATPPRLRRGPGGLFPRVVAGALLWLCLLTGAARAQPASSEIASECAAEAGSPGGFGVQPGVLGSVLAIASDGASTYVGGGLSEAGGLPARGIARWDGAAWHALGGGVDGVVYAIVVSGTDVYVGGSFSEAGGRPAHHVARWDGAAWHRLASGLSGPVYAIATVGPLTYLGGSFGRVGDVSSRNIACWHAGVSSGREEASDVRPGISLSNHPNPFAAGTTIRYHLPERAAVRLAVYDVLGREIAVLENGMREAGVHEVSFHAAELPSGTYLYRLSTPRHALVRPMTSLR